MTVAITQVKTTVLGNGSQTVFDYDFPIVVEGWAELWYTDPAGLITLIDQSEYDIAGIGNPAGGTFTYPLSGTPIPSGSKLTLIRQNPYTQATNLASQGSYDPRAVMKALDYIVYQTQQLADIATRCLRVPKPEEVPILPPAVSRAGGILGFTLDGTPTILYDVTVGTLTPESLEATGIILPENVDPTGVTDSYAGLLAWLNYLKTNGGVGFLPPGLYKISQALLIQDGVPFSIIGAGMNVCTIQRNGSFGTPLEFRRCPNLRISGITINAKNSTIPTNANQCFTALDCEDFYITECFFTDFLKSATLIFSSDPDAQVKNNFVVACGFDGLDAGGNGFLLADVDYSGIRDCWGKGVFQNNPNGPGYCFQLKNTCKHSYIINCYAESCTAVVGFGNDNNLLGVTQCTVANIRGKDYLAGMIMSYSERNVISNVDFDATGTTNSRGLLIQDGCFGNIFTNVLVANPTGASSAAVLIRNGAKNNVVNGLIIVNPEFARMVQYGTDAEDNVVHISRVYGGAYDGVNKPNAPGAIVNDSDNSGLNMTTYNGSIAYVEPSYGPTTTTPMSYFFGTTARLGLFTEDESSGGICGGSPDTSNFEWAYDYDFANRRLKLHARGIEAVRIQPGASADTRLDVTPGTGAATTGVTVGGVSGTATDVSLILRAQGAGDVSLQAGTGSAKQVRANNTGIGFYGGNPIAKPAVTGSRAGNAALASLLTALANLGLVTNSTSA